MFRVNTNALQVGDIVSAAPHSNHFYDYPKETQFFLGYVTEVFAKSIRVLPIYCRTGWTAYDLLQQTTVIFEDEEYDDEVIQAIYEEAQVFFQLILRKRVPSIKMMSLVLPSYNVNPKHFYRVQNVTSSSIRAHLLNMYRSTYHERRLEPLEVIDKAFHENSINAFTHLLDKIKPTFFLSTDTPHLSL